MKSDTTYKKWLEENGLTQSEHADLLGLAQATIGRAANGEPPTLRVAALIRAGSGGEVGYDDLLPEKARRRAAEAGKRFARWRERQLREAG